MTEALQEILFPDSDPTASQPSSSTTPQTSSRSRNADTVTDTPPDPSKENKAKVTSAYLSHLTTLSLSSINTSERELLQQKSHTSLRQLQTLARRSSKPIISALSRLGNLQSSLPDLARGAEELRDAIPPAESAALAFSRKYGNAKAVSVVAAGGSYVGDDHDDGVGSSGKDSERTDGKMSVLERRRKALLLYGNVDRVEDVLELPTLLATAISSSSSSAGAVGSTGSNQSGSRSSTSGSNLMNYSLALDLQSHTKRLKALYPDLRLIDSIAQDVELEMKRMTSNLISSLQTPNLKLAGAMRTIGWLRRVAPDLTSPWLAHTAERKFGSTDTKIFATTTTTTTIASQRTTTAKSHYAITTSSAPIESENALSTLFLACRLANLNKQLSALEPFRELAEQEGQELAESKPSSPKPTSAKSDRERSATVSSNSNSGQRTERYLKKYIEIFREHSFSIVNMHRSVFPAESAVHDLQHHDDTIKTTNNTTTTSTTATNTKNQNHNQNQNSYVSHLLPPTTVPSPLTTFVLHLSSMLTDTLIRFLPNVRDRAARDSLLTQVLYCAGSLGRLGCDFGMVIALLDDGMSDDRVDDDDENNNNEEELDEEEEEDKAIGANVAAGKKEKKERKEKNEAWAEVMKRHRMQASRLELLASGVGGSRSGNASSKRIPGQVIAQG